MKRLVKKFFNFRFILFLAAVGGSTIVGCNKNALSPVAPVRPVGLSVSIPYSQEIKSNLLGSTSNNILYRFTAPGLAPVSGSAGPFSPAGNSGTIDFSATLPSGAPWLLAVELDDAPTHQPLALGAVQLPSGTATGSVSLVMGSIARNCYRIDTWNYVAGSSFTFMNEALQTGTTGPGDISLSPVGAGGFQIQAINSTAVSIAYMGNGSLVNFAAAPTTGYASSSAASKGGSVSILQSADVYCVALGPTTHAWVQIINSGSLVVGPSFRFRVNTTVDYYAYDRITSDSPGSCITPYPTYTLTPTNTGTPTLTATITPTYTPSNSPTLTDTPTITFTPTLTPTWTSSNTTTSTFTPVPSATPTSTATNTFTYTPTKTTTNTATSTVTSSPTNSATVTPTKTSTSTTTNSSTLTATKTPTNSPTATSTKTTTATTTDTATQTATKTPTNSPSATATGTFANSATNTPTQTVTSTVTLTPTLTITGTPTATPTFSGAFQDITGNIDGAAVAGNTAVLTDGHSVTVGGDVWGFGAPDAVYQFNITSPKQLFFNLCNANFDSILYLCTDPNNPTGTLLDLADDSNYCANGSLQTTLTTGTLQNGTYYLVVDGFGYGNSGSYQLSVTTLHPTATITPNSTPVAEAEPNNDDTYFTHATNLGTVAPGLDAVGTGNVKYYLDEVDTWGFHVATDGIAVALSLDGFDDGTGKDHVALDLYDSNNNLIDSSAGNTPLDQITDILPAGDYHVAVYAITDGSDGDYRLVLRAGGATATPTGSPTVTPTPPAGGQNITSYIDSGLTIVGNTSNSTDAHTASYTLPGQEGSNIYGSSAPDIVYQIVLSQPKQLFISLCNPNTQFDTVLYLLTDPNDPISVVDLDDDSDYCGSVQSTLTTGLLSSGVTYYLVVDGYSDGESGPFNLTLSTFNPVCVLTPTSTPNPIVTPGVDTTAYSDAGYLGTVDIGSDLVGAGDVKDYLHPTDTWRFTVATAGFYNVSVDCYDDHTNRDLIAFDLFASGDLSEAIDNSPDNLYPNQTGDWLVPGDYYVEVFANAGGSDGNYHLVVQGILAGTPVVTPTPTISPTPADTVTPTITATPTVSPTSVAANGDITSFIDSGNPITGNTALSTDSHSVTDFYNDILGSSGSPDVAYTFTVTQPQGERFQFQLTPGSGFYYPILYLLGPNNTTTLSDLSPCYYNNPVNMTTELLAPGTYTVVVDEYYSDDTAGSGPFSLMVSTFHPNCVLNPTTTPVPAVTPGVDDELFTDAGGLGNVSPGSDLVGAGLVKDNLEDVNTWHFHVTAAGQYSIAADCYDDGTGKAQVSLDLYQANGSGGFQLLDETSDISYPNGFSDWLIPGDYYVAAYAEVCGSDDNYHLVIQGTLAPTPTPEAAQDITSNINSGNEILGDTTGQTDAHSYLDIEGNSWGRGAPDLVYSFTLSQPQQLDVQFGNTSGFRTLVAYLRTKQDDPSTTIALNEENNEDTVRVDQANPNGTIAGATNLITPLLKPGTYYLIIDGSGPSQYGPFFINLSTFTPNCGYVGSNAPVTAVLPNISGNATLTADEADLLGTVSSGTTLVGLGSVQYYVGGQHGWFFHAATDSALYSISLDCYDNGQELDNIGFDLYQAVTVGGVVSLNYFDSSYDTGYPDSLSETLPAGDYYVAVFSNNNGSDGEYRLIVQGGAQSTPTFTNTPADTPTITPTPMPPYGLFGSQGTGNGQFSNPVGLAVNNAGTTVYVSDYTQDRVQSFTSADGINYAYNSQWGSPGTGNFQFATLSGLTTDSTGNVYVVDANNSRVMEYDPTGTIFIHQYGFFSSNPTNGDLVAPSGVAIDPIHSQLYVTDENTGFLPNQSVAIYGIGASWLNYWSVNTFPYGIAVNSTGTTVCVGTYGSGVNTYTSNASGGVSLGYWNGSSSGSPIASRGMAFDSTGNLYVVDANDRIVKFDALGNYIAEMVFGTGPAPGQMSNPSALALDGSNYIYVLDAGNYRVEKFPPF